MAERARPRRGRVLIEEIPAEEFATESGIVVPTEADSYTKRVRVVRTGAPPIIDGQLQPFDFMEGDTVLVPYHAGRTFKWFGKDGHQESIWIVSEAEILTVFEDEGEPDHLSGLAEAIEQSIEGRDYERR